MCFFCLSRSAGHRSIMIDLRLETYGKRTLYIRSSLCVMSIVVLGLGLIGGVQVSRIDMQRLKVDFIGLVMVILGLVARYLMNDIVSLRTCVFSFVAVMLASNRT